MNLDAAKRRARQVLADVDAGLDPLDESAPQTSHQYLLNHVLDCFLERYARKKLKRADEVERIFTKYVRPRLGDRSIRELRRSDISTMLDEIEDTHGPVMADRTLAHLRKALNWWATRDDEFRPPIVRGMARSKYVRRNRVLTVQELQAIWRATAELDPYSRIIRLLILTGQRRGEIASLTWEEINAEARLIELPNIPNDCRLNPIKRMEQKTGRVTDQIFGRLLDVVIQNRFTSMLCSVFSKALVQAARTSSEISD